MSYGFEIYREVNRYDQVICISSNGGRFTPGKVYSSINGVILTDEGDEYRWMSGQIRPDGKGGWEPINEWITVSQSRINKLKEIGI